jgi:hypothetical protein
MVGHFVACIPLRVVLPMVGHFVACIPLRVVLPMVAGRG